MLAKLPPELIDLIGQYPTQAQLLRLRAVSRSLCSIYTPRVFETVSFKARIRHTPAHVNMLKTDVSHISSHIKHVIISCDRHDDYVPAVVSNIIQTLYNLTICKSLQSVELIHPDGRSYTTAIISAAIIQDDLWKGLTPIPFRVSSYESDTPSVVLSRTATDLDLCIRLPEPRSLIPPSWIMANLKSLSTMSLTTVLITEDGFSALHQSHFPALRSLTLTGVVLSINKSRIANDQSTSKSSLVYWDTVWRRGPHAWPVLTELVVEACGYARPHDAWIYGVYVRVPDSNVPDTILREDRTALERLLDTIAARASSSE